MIYAVDSRRLHPTSSITRVMLHLPTPPISAGRDESDETFELSRHSVPSPLMVLSVLQAQSRRDMARTRSETLSGPCSAASAPAANRAYMLPCVPWPRSF